MTSTHGGPRRRRRRHRSGGAEDGEPPEERGRHPEHESSKMLQPSKLSPLEILARGALVAILLYLIFGLVIPEFADYDEVWDAIMSLSWLALFTLVGLTVAIELGKSAAPSLLIDGLSLRQAFLAQETAAVVSNTIPGPSGTVAKFATYRRYGIDSIDFGRGTVMNGVWNHIVALTMPTLAIAMLATQEKVPGRVVAITLVALVISIVAITAGVLIMRSEPFARRFGELTARVVNWARGLVRRPPSATFNEEIARLRVDLLATTRTKGIRLAVVVVVKELTTYLALLVSLWAVDTDRADLTAIEVFASYAVVRLLTIIETTPGNVGVAEALYIATLSWAAPNTSQDVIVAGVFTFRMFTYLGPILIGLGCWYWLRRYFRRGSSRPDAVISDG
jgi:putative heme transporter